MKVLIVAKTRQGGGACIGAITEAGRSARLIASDTRDERWGLAFKVGDVWDLVAAPPPRLNPPHVENLIVRERRKIRSVANPVPTIEKHMPPLRGGPDALFSGMAAAAERGGLYVACSSGVPSFSTLFWRPDRPLTLDSSGKRLRYVYPSDGGSRSLVYLGFQEPTPEIPEGTLLRVSLSQWWRRPDCPEEELRCWVQLSGWFDLDSVDALSPHVARIPEVRFKPRMAEAQELMERFFGFREFRPPQDDIIASVLRKRDTLGIMPTGAGKSLCFQLPALLSNGLTVVVSPLISLMQDQIEQLRSLGVSAVALNSLLNYDEYASHMRLVRSGQARLLYVAPETLVRSEILVLLDESRVTLITIDEAHCISEWGHDFRPEYRRLRAIRDRYPDATCLALTATATERVRDDIRNILGIDPTDTFVSSFDRPNLYLEVQRRGPNLNQLKRFLAAHPDQPGILYCSTRKQVDALTAQLAESGLQALPYHAGLEDAVRRENQTRFQRDDVQIIVATIAFGMGINKPNVRFVVHCTLPECMETYYQQIGRAGRDGLRSDCLLLHGRQEIGTIMRFIEEGAEEERQGRTQRMQVMLRYAESSVCRRRSILPYFGDPAPEEACGMCDVCVSGGRRQVDVSDDARLFLACVLQTRERFGVTHVTEIVRGSQSQRVTRWKHDKLPSYGTGKHRSKEEWRALADRFIEVGLLKVDMEHGTLAILEMGGRVLGGEPTFVADVKVERIAEVAGDTGHDAILFEKLRRLRKRLADEANVPPFVVFSDRTLVEMATAYPRTLQELIRVHGVGERKIADYGQQFIEAIHAHVVEQGIALDSNRSEIWFGGKRRYREVATAFLDGLSIREIALRHEVKRSTIINHLREYVKSGGTLDPDRVLAECLLTEEDCTRALKLFEEFGHRSLGPVRDAMGGEVPYEELHLLRLHRVCAGH